VGRFHAQVKALPDLGGALRIINQEMLQSFALFEEGFCEIPRSHRIVLDATVVE
jgi:hypothetical protein